MEKLKLVELPSRDYTYSNVLTEDANEHSNLDTQDQIEETLNNWQIAQNCLFATLCVIATMAITLLCIICYSSFDSSIPFVQ